MQGTQMAKTNFLNLTNRVLRYINQSEVSTVVGSTGHSAIVKDKLNEALNSVYTKTNWYSLYTERRFQTSQNITIVVMDYTSTGDTITITRNGTATVLTEGVDWSNATSNDVSATALAAGIVTAFGTTVVETEVVNENIIVRNRAENDVGFTAVATSDTAVYTVGLANNSLYDMASDFGRSIALLDATSDTSIVEVSPRAISHADPNSSESGNPTAFAAFGNQYRLYPNPSSTLLMYDRYFKIPATLTVDADTIDLPLETESLIVKLTESELAFYNNNSIKGSTLLSHYKLMLEDAIEMNEYILSKQNHIPARSMGSVLPMIPAQFPTGYPR
jgi:hypothetical protein